MLHARVHVIVCLHLSTFSVALCGFQLAAVKAARSPHFLTLPLLLSSPLTRCSPRLYVPCA